MQGVTEDYPAQDIVLLRDWASQLLCQLNAVCPLDRGKQYAIHELLKEALDFQWRDQRRNLRVVAGGD